MWHAGKRLVLILTAVVLVGSGCGGPQPSAKELRRLESIMQLTFPPGTVFMYRHVDGRVHHLVLDVPRCKLKAFIDAAPLAGTLKDGDRSKAPVPANLDPAAKWHAAGIEPEDRPLTNDRFSLGTGNPIWNPDSAKLFKYGIFKVVNVYGSGSTGHVLIDLDSPHKERFYIVFIH